MLQISIVQGNIGITLIARDNGNIVDKTFTTNLMNTMDEGYFKNWINGGYSVSEIEYRFSENVEEYDREYVDYAWRIVAE